MTEKKTGLISGQADSTNIFGTVFENIQTGILIVDPVTHIIVDANPLAEFLTGRPQEELIGSPCHGFVCPATCGECPITDFHQEIHNNERALINKKGEKIPILKTVAKAKIQGKDYLIESFIDITDRKKSEDRRIALIAYLSEALLRVKKPLELMQEDFQELARHAADGDYNNEELRMQLQLNANNLAQIVRNLDELQREALKGKEPDVPAAFRDFFIGE